MDLQSHFCWYKLCSVCARSVRKIGGVWCNWELNIELLMLMQDQSTKVVCLYSFVLIFHHYFHLYLIYNSISFCFNFYLYLYSFLICILFFFSFSFSLSKLEIAMLEANLLMWDQSIIFRVHQKHLWWQKCFSTQQFLTLVSQSGFQGNRQDYKINQVLLQSSVKQARKTVDDVDDQKFGLCLHWSALHTVI